MKLITWIGSNGWTLLIASGAFFAGMAVMLPMGWVLDGAAAGLIGALVGAVATIGGAVLLWQVQETHRSIHLARAIAMQFGSIFFGTDELLQHLPRGDFKELVRASNNLLKDVDESKAKLDRFTHSLHLLASNQIGNLLIAEEIVKTIKLQAGRIAQLSPGEWVPDVLDDVNTGLRGNYDDLGKTLERFAPGWSDEDEHQL